MIAKHSAPFGNRNAAIEVMPFLLQFIVSGSAYPGSPLEPLDDHPLLRSAGTRGMRSWSDSSSTEGRSRIRYRRSSCRSYPAAVRGSRRVNSKCPVDPDHVVVACKCSERIGQKAGLACLAALISISQFIDVEGRCLEGRYRWIANFGHPNGACLPPLHASMARSDTSTIWGDHTGPKSPTWRSRMSSELHQDGSEYRAVAKAMALDS